MKNKGKLYGIGVGPGDPELITVKAKRILEQSDIVAAPVTAKGKESLALSIARQAAASLKNVLELVFPMTYDKDSLEDSHAKAASTIMEALDRGQDVAFITLGDATVYSTYIYIHKQIVQQGYEAEIIPGVTSFCAAAARAGTSLGENSDTIAVIPSAYECDKLDWILDSFDSVVLMKAGRNFEALKDKLKVRQLVDKAVVVGRCGLEGEVVETDIEKVTPDILDYFTTMIIKKGGID